MDRYSREWYDNIAASVLSFAAVQVIQTMVSYGHTRACRGTSIFSVEFDVSE